jgi:hypothetical protein
LIVRKLCLGIILFVPQAIPLYFWTLFQIQNFNKMKTLTIIALTFLYFGFTVQAKTSTTVLNQVHIQSDSTAMVEFKGNYKFKENPMVQNVTVRIEKDKLVADPGDGNVYDLNKDNDKADTFAIEALGATVLFVRDANKKITGMKVEVQGSELVADKEITDKK